ncbi:MAG: hypothetical protein DI537_17565 [Stutzerimonas stutzeri]|nr:MAG: hypothetical protein DI537_17565 [Stutzerimonas stutzeri]
MQTARKVIATSDRSRFLTLGVADARRAEDLAIQVCHLDARLGASGLADGWQNRADLNEATMSIQMDGALVDLGDLVLHDANMNTRAPSYELGRAAAALQAYRLARQRPAPWPLTHRGIVSLAGGVAAKVEPDERRAADDQKSRADDDGEQSRPKDDDVDPFAIQFAEIDALIARTGRVLRGEEAAVEKRSLALLDEQEAHEEAEDQWFSVLSDLEALPSVQAAAFGWQAWRELRLYERQPWLGLIVAGAILRSRGLTGHILPLAAGFRAAGYRGRQMITQEMAVGTFCDVLQEALRIANADLSTLSLNRDRMSVRLAGRRKGSKLKDLVDLFLSRPIVTMPMAGSLLDVTPRAVKLMFDELGPSLPRELTQRSRYRAWGII